VGWKGAPMIGAGHLTLKVRVEPGYLPTRVSSICMVLVFSPSR
jgi:hypothetical protein